MLKKFLLATFGLTLGVLASVLACELYFFFKAGTLYALRNRIPPAERAELAPLPLNFSRTLKITPGTQDKVTRFTIESDPCCDTLSIAVTGANPADSAGKIIVRSGSRVFGRTHLAPGESDRLLLYSTELSATPANILVEGPIDRLKDVHVWIGKTRTSSSGKGLNKPYRDVVFKQKADRKRILAIGGSTTFGMSVSVNQTWPSLLQVYLDTRYPGEYEVVNAGRLGGNLEEFIFNFDSATSEYVSREDVIREGGIIRAKGADIGWKDLRADFVIVAPVINDTAPDVLLLSNPRSRILSLPYYGLEKLGLHRWLAISEYLKTLRYSATLTYRVPAEMELSNMLRDVETGLRSRLRRFMEKWDVPVHLISLPILFNKADSAGAWKSANEYFGGSMGEILKWDQAVLPRLVAIERGVFASSGHPFSDVSTYIESLPFRNRLDLYHDSIHLNSDGMAIVAGEIARSSEKAFLSHVH